MTILGVSSVKAIFYNGTTLKTVAQLGALVNKYGLSSYCPGSTVDTKLQNLLNDRKLSYFKGYSAVNNNFILSPSYGITFVTVMVGDEFLPVENLQSDGSYIKFNYPVSTQQSTYFSYMKNQTLTLHFGGTVPQGMALKCIAKVNGVQVDSHTIGTGEYYFTVDNMYYPETIEFAIVSV